MVRTELTLADRHFCYIPLSTVTFDRSAYSASEILTVVNEPYRIADSKHLVTNRHA